LSEADREGIPIVVNDDREGAVNEMLRIIGDTLSAELAPDPKKLSKDRGMKSAGSLEA
jgi:hypothetical protein